MPPQQMNKSPMEVKLGQLLKEAESKIDYDDAMAWPLMSNLGSFENGFKAALDLPEVKALVDALEDADKELRWHAEKWSEEGFGDVKSGRSGHAYQGAENISQALKAWKSFKGE